LTAQRREEVAQITWGELDLEKAVWTLPGSRTKKGKPHIVHLSQPAVRTIWGRPTTTTYVFASGLTRLEGFSDRKLELGWPAKSASYSVPFVEAPGVLPGT